LGRIVRTPLFICVHVPRNQLCNVFGYCLFLGVNNDLWIGIIIRKRLSAATCLPAVHSFFCSFVGVMGLLHFHTFSICMNLVTQWRDTGFLGHSKLIIYWRRHGKYNYLPYTMPTTLNGTLRRGCCFLLIPSYLRNSNDSFSFYLSIAVLLAGLTKPCEVGEILALYSLKSLSLDYKAKLKSPCFFLQVTLFLQIIFVLHSYGKVKGKGVIFLTGHIQCKQSLSPRSLELRVIFKRADDHIFEKTLNSCFSEIHGGTLSEICKALLY
jgi:hypothetical protein